MSPNADSNTRAQPTYLIGTIGMLMSDEPNSCVEIHLEKRLIQGEDEKEGWRKHRQWTAADMQGAARLNQQPVHLIIRFRGTWSQGITHDLKTTLEAKLHVDIYKPTFNRSDNSWEFCDGVRADLLIGKPRPLRGTPSTAETSQRPMSFPQPLR
ncbi:hypothetical protein PGTUg99_033131 [Puccinia graminis f. sp. tritici]|uniref:Uncharacterized protein n=1 Tax=Puccinia graminis f. sp. tritici TaxID=56615 RepID=A0A5B0NJ22_PUCGR|nr:hypothetical protein PGTUg99_033131 [Puccinia graminis f. sp. tritici]